MSKENSPASSSDRSGGEVGRSGEEIATEDLLKAIFEEDWPQAWVTSVSNRELDPAGQGSWYGGRAEKKLRLCSPERDNYFSIGMIRAGAEHRNVQNLDYVGCLFLDDLGTKSDLKLALDTLGPAHFEIETSPGNWSWLYLLECESAPGVPAKYLAAFEEVMERLALLGVTDPGARDAVRYCRLPGTNNKPKHGANGFRVVVRRGGASLFEPLKFETLYFKLTGAVDMASSPGAVGLGGGSSARVRLDDDGNPLPSKFSGRLDTPDPWLRAMSEVGLVKGEGNKPGVVEITCPFVHEHTDRDDGSAYLGDGMFKCHHGHCVDRDHREFQAEVARKLELGAGKRMSQVVFDRDVEVDLKEFMTDAHRDLKAKQEQEAANWDRVLDEWVYVLSQEKFARMDGEGGLLGDKQFGVAIRGLVEVGESGKKTGFAQFHQRKGRVVQTMDYLPGRPRICVRERDGKEVFNRWSPSSVTPVMGVQDQDVKPWLDVVDWVYGKDVMAKQIVLDFMAWLVQRPGEKINWAIITKSGQGTGKDSSWKPIKEILGSDNVSMVDMAMLENGFNGWAECQLGVIEEISSSNRTDVYNKLKPYVAAPPSFLTINEKFQKPYKIDNTLCMIGFTNKDSALALEASDRRFWVYESEAAALPPKLAGRFHDWLRDAGAQALGKIMGWLLDRDIGLFSGFSPHQCPAAVGTAKDDMIEAARSSVDQWVRDWLDTAREGTRNVVSVAEIMEAGKSAPQAVRKQLTSAIVGRTCKAEGLKPWRNGAQVSTPHGRTKVWALNVEGMLMDDAAMRDELKDAKNDAMGFA